MCGLAGRGPLAEASPSGQYAYVLSADEMPDDNAELAEVEVDFPRLDEDAAESCPVSLDDLLRYLADEAPGGESLAENRPAVPADSPC